MRLKVLHQSSHFIVINKPHDVLINSNDETKATVATLMKSQFVDLYDPAYQHGFRILHRLDYSTSGIMVFPLSAEACRLAARSLQSRTANKFYLGVVRGHTSFSRIRVNLGIGPDTRDEYNAIRMACQRDAFCGPWKDAQTDILVLATGHYHNEPVTKVLMRPRTGRRHQLRLHCHALGHTLLGDYTYSDRQDTGPSRMYLHAYRMVIPTTLEHLDLCSPDPFDIQDFCAYEELHPVNSETCSLLLSPDLHWPIFPSSGS